MHRFRDLPTARKLVISMMLTTGLALGLATIGFSAHQIVQFRRSVNARVTTLADSLGANGAGALAFQDEDAALRVVRSVEGQRYIVIACFYIPEGPLLAEYRRDAGMACPVDAGGFSSAGDGALRHLSRVDYEGDSVGFVGLVADQEELWANLRDYAGIVVALLFVSLGAAWALALSLRSMIAKPLLHLVSVARTVTERRDYSIRAVPASEDEVGLLCRTFNNMLCQLEADAEERQTATQNLKAARDKAEAASLAKSHFLANMSHELRTPLNGIIGMSELLTETELDEEQQHCAKVVVEAGKSLLSIISDILDFSKVEAGKLEMESLPFDLNDIIGDAANAVAAAAHSKKLELVLATEDELPVVIGDAGRTRQILVNLLSNAVKFTERGEITVRATAESRAEQRVLIRLEVSDTGIGIAPETLATLFQPFVQADASTTRRFGGTGLGLAIVTQFAKLMGGEVSVRSTPGAGSTFDVTLDFPVANQATAPAQPDRLRGLRALIVDDNRANLGVLLGTLRQFGLETVGATDGHEALKAVAGAAGAGRPFDFGILDFMMPEMDGVQLARELKRDPALNGMRLLLLTSVVRRGLSEQAAEAGILASLHKPVRRSHLLATLLKTLADHAQPEPNASPDPHIRRRLTGARILLAEDNPVNQVVLMPMLSHLGCTPVLAVDGREAVDRATTNTYDVILMDCQMPVLDGYAAAREIRSVERDQGAPRVPIVALTASAMQGERERCLAAGMDDCLTKPLMLDVLACRLQQWLSPAGADDMEDPSGSPSGPDTVSPRVLPDGPMTADGQPTAHVPALDQAVIDGIRRLTLPGGSNVLEQAVDVFLDSISGALDELRGAVEQGDRERFGRVCHKLKSSTAMVGAMTLSQLLKDAESAARLGEMPRLPTLVESIRQEYSRVQTALQDLVPRRVHAS